MEEDEGQDRMEAGEDAGWRIASELAMNEDTGGTDEGEARSTSFPASDGADVVLYCCTLLKLATTFTLMLNFPSSLASVFDMAISPPFEAA